MSIDVFKEIICSDLAPIVQGFQFLQALEPFRELRPLGLNRSHVTADIILWMRNLSGQFIAVNKLLSSCTNIMADEFYGLTYDSYSLDRHLVEQRKHTDKIAVETRRPVLSMEQSVYGKFQTLTVPVLDICGSILATAHMAMLCQGQDDCPLAAASLDRLSRPVPLLSV